MDIILCILIFLVTIYAIETISKNGVEVKVGEAKANKQLTSAGCLAIAIVTVALDIICLYIILRA